MDEECKQCTDLEVGGKGKELRATMIHVRARSALIYQRNGRLSEQSKSEELVRQSPNFIPPSVARLSSSTDVKMSLNGRLLFAKG
jgi:hypothetical protein